MKKIKNELLLKIIFLSIFFIFFYFAKENLIISQKGNNFKCNLNDSLFEALENSKNFVYNADNGILTKMIPTSIIENPNISVIIPMFNTENLIRRSILSIQNQNISDFEIIIINDCSTDNSINIVKKLSIQDKRIKIINNNKNMGLLYSRCIGTLISKGKYIFPLDSDDMYLIHDTLFNVFNEVQNNKPDILKFRGIKTKTIENFFNKTNVALFRGVVNKNRIIYQPELANNSYLICSLQALSIDSELYKKVITLLGKTFLYEHISYNEDCITHYIMSQNAKAEEQYLKIGYLNIYRETSNSHNESYINKIKSRIYYTETIFKYSLFENKNRVFATRDLVTKIVPIMKNHNMTLLLHDNKMRKLLKWIINEINLNKLFSNENQKYILKMFDIIH